MRYWVGILGVVAAARLFSGCDLGQADPAAAKPRLLAAGDLNTLYVAQARGEGDAAVFRFWQRDARGTWHEGAPGQGVIAAAAAWRENLLVFFPSGRYGLFGLGKPVIQPSPVAAWTPAAVCEDGLAVDAFGWNAAGEPVSARHEEGKWSWRRVDADLKRGKVLDPALVRFTGRLFLVWREEEPSLTGAAPSFRLWFAWQDKDGWHVPARSRLYVASAPAVAATSNALACLFLKAQGDGKPDLWTLATYAKGDEDWHETGTLAGSLPAGPLVLVRSGEAFHVVGLEEGRPVVSALEVPAARAGPFLAFTAAETVRPQLDYSSVIVFGLAALSLILVLVSWQKARRAAGSQAASGAGAAAQGAAAAERRRSPGGWGYVPAPIYKRGVAVLIDYFLLGILVTVVITHLAPDLRPQWVFTPDLMFGLTLHQMAMLQAIYFALGLVYFTLSEALFGRTLGKRLMGLRVRSESGSPIVFWQALVRNLLRFADEFPAMYLLGVLFIMMGPRPQRLGDRAARTLVVLDRPAGPERPPEG